MKEIVGIGFFANPEVLILLLVLPAYVYWYLRYYEPRRLIIRLSYDPEALKPPRINLAFLRFVPRVLQVTAMAFIIIAGARPQTATELIENRSEGIDIMLLMDASSSMETEDFFPNRLEVAKRTAISFVNGRKEDRIGLVLFAEQALSYAPLTLDYQLLNTLITEISFRLIPKDGTAIGDAIGIGINRLRESQYPSQVMILITDGANNEGQLDPVSAARLARQFGIRIYCIGIGKPQYTRQFPLGATREIRPELDEDGLKNIAQITGGTFFRSEDEQTLSNIFAQISQLETVEMREEVFREVTDLYPKYLKIGIVLLGLAFLSMLSFMYNPLEQ